MFRTTTVRGRLVCAGGVVLIFDNTVWVNVCVMVGDAWADFIFLVGNTVHGDSSARPTADGTVGGYTLQLCPGNTVSSGFW